MRIIIAFSCALVALPARPQSANPIPERAYGALHWRFLGPFRGGRALAIEGVPGDPATMYFGAVAGGVWRTRNAGVTWDALSDDQPFSSIGALALAPSNPQVIYVGTGEADMRNDITYGDGMWKSTDAGRHWTHLGLDSTRQIGRILVDPHDPDLLLVAALGHSYGPNAERGVFRSTDGGRTWRKVLYRDAHTGAIDLAFDPTDPRVVYAALWQAERPPWSQYPPNEGPGSGLFKSTDEGQTWTELTGHGLPAGALGRIGVAVARGSAGATVYAIFQEAEHTPGLYRSDDAGASWRLTSADPRFIRGWYFGQVFVDPTNADVVYVPDRGIFKSSDGGRTFAPFKSSPGGDDYHYVWIDPTNARHMAFAGDQGVGVSLDAGATWSDWYNQPTAQMYHVITDNRFPYRIYGTQQDVGGSVAIASRSDYGELTDRDWYPVGALEGGYVAIDPADTSATIVYGGGPYGVLFRFDRTTGQVQEVTPWPAGTFGEPMPDRKYRATWTSPLVFDPFLKHTLYFGVQMVLRSTDGGLHWAAASPDLTGAVPGAPHADPPTVATAAAAGWGVVYTIAPSPVRAGCIWAGTDNGRIHLTTDSGRQWRDVTPPGLLPWSKVSLIDASPLDPATAYAAIDRHRLDDIQAYIYRTHDGGRHWSRADAGLPDGAYVRAVRADPVRAGLLYAGTESGVYVSFDDGDHWQSLERDLPISPVHDLVVHGADLVVATHGRGFWLLDDVALLRQLTPASVAAGATLFRPEPAIRLRRSENQEVALPPEVPQGENPPAGAIIDYWLASAARTPVRIDILDATGAIVRHFTSDTPADSPEALSPTEAPFFTFDWLPRSEPPAAAAGGHRFIWDLRYPRPPARGYTYSISAIAGHGTVAEPEGPLVRPGSYIVRLTVDGTTYRQPLRVLLDPRVHVAPQALAAQLDLATRIWRAMADAHALDRAVDSVEGSLRTVPRSPADAATGGAADALGRALAAVAVQPISDALSHIAIIVEAADREPPAQTRAVFTQLQSRLAAARARWDALVHTELAALNARLRTSGAAAIEAPRIVPDSLTRYNTM